MPRRIAQGRSSVSAPSLRVGTAERNRSRGAVRHFPKILSLFAALMLASPGTPVRAEDEIRAKVKPIHLVVVQPPETFNDTATRLGFFVVEQTLLGALGVNAVRLRVPRGETAESAVAILRAQFPNLVFGGENFEEMDTSSALKPAI